MRKITLLVVFLIVSVSFVPVNAPETPTKRLVGRGPNWDEYDNGDGTLTRTIYSYNRNIFNGSGYVPFTKAVGLTKTGVFDEILILSGLNSITTLTFSAEVPSAPQSPVFVKLPFQSIIGFNTWVNDTGGGYKWGYNLQLPNSRFRGVVDIESDRPLTISDNDTWVDGMRISFRDVIEHNYTYTVERIGDCHVRYVITKDWRAHGISVGQMIEIDPTVEIGRGAAPDSYIDELFSSANHGDYYYLQIRGLNGYRRRIIIRFDLSTLPAGSTITNAVLYLYCYNSGGTITMDVHRVNHGTPNYETDWTEAGVTWLTYDGTNNWGTAGGNFNTTPTDSITITGTGWWSWDVTSDCDELATRSWIFNDPDSHNIVDSFYSKEYTDDTSLRPYLEVTYTTAPPAVSISVTPTEYDFGVVALNTIASTGTGGYFNVTNDGTATEDFTIRGSNATDGSNVWVLASTNGADQYKLEYSKDGTNWYLVNLTAATLATSKAGGEYETVDIRITTPTSTSSYQQHTLNVTFGAIAS